MIDDPPLVIILWESHLSTCFIFFFLKITSTNSGASVHIFDLSFVCLHQFSTFFNKVVILSYFLTNNRIFQLLDLPFHIVIFKIANRFLSWFSKASDPQQQNLNETS